VPTGRQGQRSQAECDEEGDAMRMVQTHVSEHAAVSSLAQDGYQSDQEKQQCDDDIDRKPLARSDSLQQGRPRYAHSRG